MADVLLRVRKLHTAQTAPAALAVSPLDADLTDALERFLRLLDRPTAMSPVQFQKRIRLHEARCMLLSQDVDATHVSVDVGYESASQFNREYRRLFGSPPRRDRAAALG